VRDLGGALVQLTGEVFALDKARRQQVIPNEVAGRRFRKVRKRFLYYLKQAICQDESTQAARVAKNILKSEEMMWRFVKHLDLLEPTNNLAERQLRKYVIYRKRSFFTWSERGNRFLERILSLFLSCRQQQLNPFQLLSQIAAS
jgi:transposase